MPIRNPFARRQDENLRPTSLAVSADGARRAPPTFERVDTTGSKASSGPSISSRKSHDTGDYKLSVVNDSGVYLPPSPTEEKPTWSSRHMSRNSSDVRSDHGEIEHFPITRESFDSYRRSFDISARSPVIANMEQSRPQRQSLDSARFPRAPRSSLHHRRLAQEQGPTEEEDFEDVGLGDEADKSAQQPKRRGFFSKLTESTNQDAETSTTNSRFHLPGRKRGQSGQGAELGAMSRPKTAELQRVDTGGTVTRESGD